MGFEQIIEHAQVYLLIFVRVFAVLRISPLISSAAVPGIARIGLALFTSVAVFPWVLEAGYPIPDEGLNYALLLAGEALVGIILGFFLVIVYSAFLVAGQFFSLQMGFGASQVFDPLALVEIPMMGQFLNVIAMFVFISTNGLQKIFLSGVLRSFQTVRAVDLVASKDAVLPALFRGISTLFEQALVISFPILGTLLVVFVTMGLLAKAAPQMNLLMFGFPVSISVAFFMLFLTLPFIMEAFTRIIDGAFEGIMHLLRTAEGAVL